MTELYKKNGAVFVPVGITLEEVEDLKDDNKVMADDYSKMEQKFYDNFTKAKEIIEDIIKFQPYIDRDAMFLTIGNDWKEVIFKAEQFLNGEVEKPIESSVEHIIEQNEKEVGLNPDYFSGGW